MRKSVGGWEPNNVCVHFSPKCTQSRFAKASRWSSNNDIWRCSRAHFSTRRCCFFRFNWKHLRTTREPVSPTFKWLDFGFDNKRYLFRIPNGVHHKCDRVLMRVDESRHSCPGLEWYQVTNFSHANVYHEPPLDPRISWLSLRGIMKYADWACWLL